MPHWQLTPRGQQLSGVTGKRHVLNASLRTAVTVFESERNAIRHSAVLGDAEMTPAEAVVRLAIHYPAKWDEWRS